MGPTPPSGSLALRLVLSALAIMLAVLLVVGLVLSTLYARAAERAFDRRLGVYLKMIVAEVANASGADVPEPQALSDPLFIFPNSGWYWQIAHKAEGGSAVKTSRSLRDARLPRAAPASGADGTGAVRQGYGPGPRGETLRVVERELDFGADGSYVVSVAAVSTELDSDVAGFNMVLVGTLIVLGLAFLLVVLFQVRFGLKPLSRISQALSDVRSGEAERLVGAYPVEIVPLVREVNALIDANREVVQRARTHVGNLAHALKTPLSVLLNEAGTRGDPLAARVRDQVSVMRDQVAHHLERARMAARPSIVVGACDVAYTVTALARTMEKIHRAKGLAIDVRILDGVRFRGEQQDLEEMVGNLVDNACKWARSRVDLEVRLDAPRPAGGAPFFRVVIDDDGPGLDPARRAEVGQRGRRLDESMPGSGLGLSIVHELALLYGGSLELGSAPGGGLRTELVLPAVMAPSQPGAAC
ncbi:ATP-binding protein [Xanthobacter variabilis]|uniref:ATP-binding protein n=1 Tax=Xanthobacter variabilis TaxID=3119932 RepID=UPI00374E774F